MTRIPQMPDGRGSQKWLQHFVEKNPTALQPRGMKALTWLSPLANDDFAEYMDGAFLQHLGLPELVPALPSFWPVSGPRWDGLARVGSSVVLVEAKAHIAEALSTPSAASAPASRSLISASLAQTKTALGADDRSDWSRCFYQLANRIAHLWWLRENNIDAHLLFVGFLSATDMPHPATLDGWEALYLAANHALGLRENHLLSRYIHHVYPDVSAA